METFEFDRRSGESMAGFGERLDEKMSELVGGLETVDRVVLSVEKTDAGKIVVWEFTVLDNPLPTA